MRLLTNNPSKRAGLEGYGLSIVGRVPLPVRATADNLRYLTTKRDRMGHDLPDLPAAASTTRSTEASADALAGGGRANGPRGSSRRGAQRAAARPGARPVAVRAAGDRHDDDGSSDPARPRPPSLHRPTAEVHRAVSGTGSPAERPLDAHGLRIAIVAARWHSEVSDGAAAPVPSRR